MADVRCLRRMFMHVYDFICILAQVRLRSNFKSRSIANDVEVLIPVPTDVDSPKFKAGVGSVTYAPDSNAMKWTVKKLYGSREYNLKAEFGLPSVDAGTSAATNARHCVTVYC